MIINNITENIGDYLRRKRINLTELSKKTGIHYNSLYASVWDRSRRRDLRANELMSICVVLGINPIDFIHYDTNDLAEGGGDTER